VEIVLIHREAERVDGVEQRPGMFPDSNLRLEAGDRLLVLSSLETIHKVRNL